MDHLQQSARAELAYCSATPGSAAEAAALAQANAELKAAKADLTKVQALVAPYEGNTSTTDNSQAV
jgi:hypothetical protein